MRVVFFFLLLSSSAISAQSDTAIQRIGQYIDSFKDDTYFGASVKILKGDDVILERYEGAASWEHGTPIDAATIFNLASIGKLFTATRALQLVQAGELDLNEPIKQYLSDSTYAHINTVTTHQLLTHTSGLPLWPSADFAMIPKFQYNTISDYAPFFEDIHVDTAKIGNFNYSNVGFLMLGVLIEALDDMSYEESMAKYVFEVANMHETDIYDLMDVIPNKATGYTRPNTKLDNWKTNNHLNMGGNPAGGGYSMVGDLQRFLASLRAHELLDAKHTQLMMSPQVVRFDEHYGYGMAIRTRSGQTAIGHDGGFWGVRGEVFWYKEADYTVSILTNSDHTYFIDLSHCIETQLFGTPAQKEAWENTLLLIDEAIAHTPKQSIIDKRSQKPIDEMLLEIKAYYFLNFNNKRSALKLFELYVKLFPESESAIGGLKRARARFE